MKIRKYWLKRIHDAWAEKNVIWLSGVRRTGKTVLSQTLTNTEYFDCEIPATRTILGDPESFLNSLSTRTIIIDEIHRLANPTELLKIAADHYPKIKILATGSSSLSASTKFQDKLTDRKVNIWLTPMNDHDLEDFGDENLKHRLLHGGLPPFFLSRKPVQNKIQDWIDSYWSKDIQELFRIERRAGFLKFFELLMIQSGGIFEASSFAAPCEVSRPTIMNFLSILDLTYVANILRPFNSNLSSEIIAAPKVYGFDTGFVCALRGWDTLRADDMGILWEHYVLNELHAVKPRGAIQYWRDKRGHEVDFILRGSRKDVIALECKWTDSQFGEDALVSFRQRYPQGNNFCVCHNVKRPYRKKFRGVEVMFTNVRELVSHVNS